MLHRMVRSKATFEPNELKISSQMKLLTDNTPLQIQVLWKKIASEFVYNWKAMTVIWIFKSKFQQSKSKMALQYE